MTPKEKAEQLYEAYKKVLNINNDMRSVANPFVKDCALICVEEIEWEIIKYADNSKDYVVENGIFWNEVKQEIETL